MKRSINVLQTPGPALDKKQRGALFSTPIGGIADAQGAVEGVSTPDTVFPSQQPFPHTAERLFGGLTVATPNDNTPKLGVPGPSRPAGGAGRSRLAPHASQAASDGQQPDASGSGSQQEDNADAPALDDVSNHYTQQQAQSNSQPRSAAGRHHDGRVGDERQQEHRSTRKGAGPLSTPGSDCGFQLRCSQSYTRLTGRPPSAEKETFNTPTPEGSREYSNAGPLSSSLVSGGEASESSAGLGPSSSAVLALLGGTQASTGQLPASQAPQQSQYQPLQHLSQQQPALSHGTSMTPPPGIEHDATTPELGAVGVAASQDPDEMARARERTASTPTQYFALFRRRTERKLVILLRHGQSQYNALERRNGTFADPQVFDAQLTPKGRQQCLAARAQLARELAKHEPKMGAPLWVVSPLSRALETFLLACPDLPLPAGEGGAGAPVGALPPALNVVVHAKVAERCYTCGDVGRPASELAEQFPSLGPCLATMKERWWYRAEGERRNCAQQGQLLQREDKRELERRVTEFLTWMMRREERIVVIVGHSLWHKAFLSRDGARGDREVKSMANGELRMLYK